MTTTQDLMGLGMPPLLAVKLAQNPASLSGTGTTQTGATLLVGGQIYLATPTSSNTAFLLQLNESTGKDIFVWNQSSSQTALVYPPTGGTINGGSANASVSLPPLTGALFQLYNGSGVANETWGCLFGNSDSPSFTNLVVSGTLGVTGVTTATGGLVVGPGSATVVPLKLTSGTLNTTSSAGEVEYDGSVFYGDVAASQRGIIPTESYLTNNAAITLTATASAQSMFAGTNGTTSGALTLPIGTYEFETQFALTALSATSGSFGWGLLAANSAVIGAQLWTAVASKVAAGTVQAVDQSFNTATSTAITSATTATAGCALIKGTFTLTTGGSIAPQISLANSATPVVSAGSYFKCNPVGLVTATLIDVGNWS